MNSSKLSVIRVKFCIRQIFVLLAIAVTFSACEEVIDVDLNNAAPQLVVEGWIYNTPGPYEIKLTFTTNYFENEEAPKVDNALVIISENTTLVDTLIMSKPGVYKTQKILDGKIGATYSLRIFYNNKTYEAIATMKPVAPIDSLSYRYKEKTVFDDAGYYVSVHFQEPSTLGDYYRWLYYRNGELYKKKDEVYASDELYNGNYISFECDYNVNLNDTIYLAMFSLEKNGYDFFNALDEQDNTGDLFDTPPGNVKGNISNGGIGYFGASAKTVGEIVIN
jgi:hypothetical protein